MKQYFRFLRSTQVLTLLTGMLLFLSLNHAHAQSIRYMDESGQLHFVDSLYQVPMKYRDQVVAPTPVPTGKPRRVRPTPTPKPTKTPRPPKGNKKQQGGRTKGGLPPLPLNNYPAPGQLPQGNIPNVGASKPGEFPPQYAAPVPAGVPSGVINPALYTPTATATPTITPTATETPLPPTPTPLPTPTKEPTFEEKLLMDQQM
jgi:hypothetical protein